MILRAVLLGLIIVLVFVAGLGGGYLQWGQQAAELTGQLQREQDACANRLAEAGRRIGAAEARAAQERAARQVFEEELHRIRPLK